MPKTLLRGVALIAALTTLLSSPAATEAHASSAFACLVPVCSGVYQCLDPENMTQFQWQCDMYCGGGWYVGGCTDDGGGCAQVVCHHAS